MEPVTRADRPSPYQWLWEELARRYGVDVAEELKAGYLAQNRRYAHLRWHAPESPAASKRMPGWARKKRGTRNEER